ENDAAVAAGCGVPFIAMAYGYPRVPVTELGAAIVLERFADLPDALKRL
ncbi:MAG: phosphoglycolate phosphatase, partial [Oceanibaculum nanhaiense]|nr:phosphoglycolate phosphatase [Oceanibaculum nanhaiense]